MRLQGHGNELVDERRLWPDGKFPTTVLIVSSRFLADHRAAAVAWLRGQNEAVRWLNEHPQESKAVVNRAIAKLTSRAIPATVLDESWQRLEFSSDVSTAALAKLAKDAEALGYLPSSDVSGLVAELGAAQ
jgi:NitT/TauT family transport system substrate-binding protein